MSRRLLIILLLLSVSVNLGVIGAVGFRAWKGYCESGKTPRRKAGGEFPEFAKLQMTDEQSQRWKHAHEEMMKGLGDIEKRVHEERQTLFDLLHADAPDREKIAQQVEKIGALQQEIQKMVVNELIERKEFLSDEQWKQFLGLMGEHMPGIKGRMRMAKGEMQERGRGADRGVPMRGKGRAPEPAAPGTP